MGDEVATMLAAADGIPRAHVMLPPMEGVPPHISSYLRVADVDAGLAAAIESGGSMVVPPADIPPGRFAGVASPSGAVFLLFHEADEASAENPGASNGAIHWVELHSTDLATDVAWMESSFGIGHQKMQMPDAGDYFIFVDGETQVGGAMAAMSPEMPSAWMVWFQVDDVDACADRIKGKGGQILSDVMDMEGIGRMYVAMDSTGAAFGIITPA